MDGFKNQSDRVLSVQKRESYSNLYPGLATC